MRWNFSSASLNGSLPPDKESFEMFDSEKVLRKFIPVSIK
jgi:hypothetical protein